MLFETVMFYTLCVIYAKDKAKSNTYLKKSSRARTMSFENTTVSSAAQCRYECTVTEDCNSVTYRDGLKQCELSSTKLEDVASNSALDNDSVIWFKL